jgi:hypothetical protein
MSTTDGLNYDLVLIPSWLPYILTAFFVLHYTVDILSEDVVAHSISSARVITCAEARAPRPPFLLSLRRRTSQGSLHPTT